MSTRVLPRLLLGVIVCALAVGRGLLLAPLALLATRRHELLHGLLVRGLQLRRLLLEGCLLRIRHGPPIEAGELADDGALPAAGLLLQRIAVVAEPDPVGVR